MIRYLNNQSGGSKTFFHAQLCTKFILLKNVKMETFVEILIFIGFKIQHFRDLKQETSSFVGILDFMSS